MPVLMRVPVGAHPSREGGTRSEPFCMHVRHSWLMKVGAGVTRAIAVVLVVTVASVVGTAVASPTLVASAAARPLTSDKATLTRAVTAPTAASVGSSGRFTKSVELDHGVFSVVPAGHGKRPRITQKKATAMIWASPKVEGAHAGPLGYGLVTVTLRGRGVPRITRLLAWVGFARHTAAYSCPEQSSLAPPLPALPSDGYSAVVIGAVHGSPAVVYTARSAVCGSLQPATLTNASEAISIPWRPTGSATNGAIELEATVPPCGTVAGITSGGSAEAFTITVAATVPDVLSHCGGASTVAEKVNFGPVGNPPHAPPPVVTGATQILHGQLGPLRLTVTG